MQDAEHHHPRPLPRRHPHRRRVRALAILAAGALLGAARTPAAASEGLRVRAPAGFAAKRTARDGSAYEVVARGDDAGCEIAFKASRENAGRTQAEINAVAARPDYLEAVRASVGARIESPDIAPFEAGGVRGSAIVGTPAGSGGGGRALLVVLDTLSGRTSISCAAPSARFAALRPRFEAVARGVTPPR